MLHYAVALFVVGLVAALLGFGSVAAIAVTAAKALFVLFALLAVAGFLASLFHQDQPLSDG